MFKLMCAAVASALLFATPSVASTVTLDFESFAAGASPGHYVLSDGANLTIAGTVVEVGGNKVLALPEASSWLTGNTFWLTPGPGYKAPDGVHYSPAVKNLKFDIFIPDGGAVVNYFTDSSQRIVPGGVWFTVDGFVTNLTQYTRTVLIRGDNVLIDNLRYESVPTMVPEPGTWALLIVGFGLVGGALRRRRETWALA